MREENARLRGLLEAKGCQTDADMGFYQIQNKRELAREIDKNKGLLTTTAELRRQAGERVCAKTAELHPSRTEEATKRLGQGKRWLDGEGQS
jgi:hypothetical protein